MSIQKIKNFTLCFLNSIGLSVYPENTRIPKQVNFWPFRYGRTKYLNIFILPVFPNAWIFSKRTTQFVVPSCICWSR